MLKLTFRNILILLLIIFLLAAIFSGCGKPTLPPVITGIISGRAAVPIVSARDITGYTPIANAKVTITDTEGVIHTTYTDNEGYYHFDNLSVKAGTIINIVKELSDGGKKVYKDVIPIAVSAGENYDASTADAESTALALIVEELVNLGQVQEEIDLDEITSSDGFDELKEEIEQTQEDNQDITTDNQINTQTEEIADNMVNPPTPEPESEPSPTPDPSPAPTPTYTVTYDGNEKIGGNVPTDSNTYQQGAEVTVKNNTGSLEKTGYTFDGWNTKADGSGTDRAVSSTFTMGASNVTLYAQWTIDSYTVTFDKDDIEAAGTMADQTIASGSSANLTACAFTKTGWTFAGWAETSGGAVAYADQASYTMGTSNVTLYAKWTINSYTVTYDGNGNTGGTAPTDATNYDYGTSVTVLGKGDLVKTQDGISFLFEGWNIAADGSGNDGTDYTVGVTFNMGSANVILHAQWSVIRGTGPAGGLIFYDNGSYVAATATVESWRYLEAAPSDQSEAAPWGCEGTLITGADGLAVGTGEQNTIDIVDPATGNTGCTTAGTAAYICVNLSLDIYNDWFLPSKEELGWMYTNLHVEGVGDFVDIKFYWSSSEYYDDADDAWGQYFHNGDKYNGNKDGTCGVRAVRAF